MNNLSTLDEISLFRRSHPAAKLIIDTNVLLLLFVGTYSVKYLPSCPLMTDNGKKYNLEQFNLLKKIINIFVGNIVITPHILSEISNLSMKGINIPDRDPCFKMIIEKLRKIIEQNVSLEKLLDNLGITEFGFTDMSIVEVASEKKKDRWVILTDEIELFRFCESRFPTISFSRIVASAML